MRDNQDGYRPRNTAPVNVGDEIDVQIEAVGEKGDGIAKKQGFVIFVPNTKQGDNVKVRVTRVLKKVGFAEVIGQGAAPAEDSEGSQESQEDSQDDSSEEAQEDSQDDSGEDSEDFGEDLVDEEDKQ